MKTLLYIKLLCLLTAFSFSQNLNIKGTLTDKKTSKPIKKAKLTLYNYKDSLLNETFTDKKGHYSLNAGGNGNYYMLVNKKDYSKKKIVFGAISESIDSGNITLKKKTNPFKSQHYLNTRKNSKGLTLKVTDLKTIAINGKTYWTVKTILSNHKRDTLYYFGYRNCESVYYLPSSGVDSLQLHSTNEGCDSPEPLTVLAVPPHSRRIVNLEIHPVRPMTSTFKLRIYFMTAKANNLKDRIQEREIFASENRPILVVSKDLQVKILADKSVVSK
jgi:hypothetical protein